MKRMLLAAAMGAVFVSLIAGCGYSKMYGQYAALQAQACSGDDRQPLIEFMDSGGQPVKVYDRSQPCRIELPDNPGRIAADVGKSVVGNAVKGVIGFKGLDELGETLREGYRQAGDQVGRDGVIGDGGSDIFTDKTADPTIVEQPAPIIVEPPDEGG